MAYRAFEGRRASDFLRIVGILILVSEIETKVVDHVSSIFDDIGAVVELAGSSLATEVLEPG